MTLLEMTSARRGSLRRVSGPAALRRAARERGGEQARHVPTLARELLELLDPQPGQCAIDCTFGDGGHARLVAERLGPSGTLVAIDRDPVAEEGFARLEREVPCAVRFIRAGYAEALELLARERLRADLAYFDLGMSWMQVDARERGFSYSYDAPLDMRMDPDQELDARTSGTSAAWRGRCATSARSVAPRRSPVRSCVAARARPSRPRSSWSRRSTPPFRRRPASAAATRPSAPSRHFASPSTMSSGSSTGRSRALGGCSAPADRWRRSAFTRSRTGA